MVCSGFRDGVEDFGGEWEGVMVLEMGKGIMGYEEWNFAGIGKEYYGSGKKLHDFLRAYSYLCSHVSNSRPAKTDLSTCTRCWLRTGSTLEYLPELKRERNSRSWSDRRRWIFRLLGGRKFFHGYRYRPKQRISAATSIGNTTIRRSS